MEKTDLEYFRGKLETEKIELETELRGIAKINPDNPSDWQAVPAETGEVAFRDETADRLEEFDDREATVQPLEIRLKNINDALKRMTDNAYGTCSVCQKPIERERLEANPAAATCKQHLDND